MITDNSFQRRLRAIAARFHDWSRDLGDHADFETTDNHGYWRFAANPHVPNACPFEILVHPGDIVDFYIDDRVYEERRLEPLDTLLSLVKAISEGHVITRLWYSALTGMVLASESIITMEDGGSWSERRVNEQARHLDGVVRNRHDRRFVPYRRSRPSRP